MKDYKVVTFDTGAARPGMTAIQILDFGDKTVWIDAGSSYGFSGYSTKLDGNYPEQVLLTHLHLDHSGALGDLVQASPSTKVCFLEKSCKHLIDPERLNLASKELFGAENFEKRIYPLKPVPENSVVKLEDGGRPPGLEDFRLLYTPGHARHHVVYFDEKAKRLFAGDSLGICYPEISTEKGKLYFLPSSPGLFEPDAWRASLKMIISLEPREIHIAHYGQVESMDELFKGVEGWLDFMEAMAPGGSGKEELEKQIRGELEAELVRRAGQISFPTDKLLELFDWDLCIATKGLIEFVQRKDA